MKNNVGCLGLILGLWSKDPTEEARTEEPVYPYGLRYNFLTKAELRFFHVFVHCLPQNSFVTVKVRLADILYTLKPRQNQGAQNKIQMKHLDFVICDFMSMTPLLAIELDDSSHERSDRKARDEFVDAALKQAGLALLRIKVADDYDHDAIRNKITQAMKQR